jgi:hypothetical protein
MVRRTAITSRWWSTSTSSNAKSENLHLSRLGWVLPEAKPYLTRLTPSAFENAPGSTLPVKYR